LKKKAAMPSFCINFTVPKDPVGNEHVVLFFPYLYLRDLWMLALISALKTTLAGCRPPPHLFLYSKRGRVTRVMTDESFILHAWIDQHCNPFRLNYSSATFLNINGMGLNGTLQMSASKCPNYTDAGAKNE
jgi:hypothetical protein